MAHVQRVSRNPAKLQDEAHIKDEGSWVQSIVSMQTEMCIECSYNSVAVVQGETNRVHISLVLHFDQQSLHSRKRGMIRSGPPGTPQAELTTRRIPDHWVDRAVKSPAIQIVSS